MATHTPNPRHFRPEFGKFVRFHREELGYSRREVALSSGMDPSYMTLIERGYTPERKAIKRLALAIEVSEYDLMLRAGFAPGAEFGIGEMLGTRKPGIDLTPLDPALREVLVTLAGMEEKDQFMASMLIRIFMLDREKEEVA